MAEHVIVSAQTDPTKAEAKDVASVVDSADAKVQVYVRARLEVWNTGTLVWDKMTQPGGGGGGAVTVADGADVTQGAIADAAVSTDATGTVNAHLRGVVKLLAAGINVAFAAAQHVIVDSTSSTVDVSDRAGRLVGVVSAANLDVALSTRLKPADTLTAVTTVTTVTAVTAITNPVTANGDVDHDAVNTLKNIQVAGNASPVKTTPTAISATGDRVRAWLDQYGRVVVGARKLATYAAVYRLAVTNAEADFTFTHVANTDKQYATIYHAATAVKLVKIKRIELWLDNVATAAGIFFVELRRLSAVTAPATGNPAITPLAFNTVDGAAETTCLALPTTAGSESAANSPIASLRVDLGITTAGPTTNPLGQDAALVLWEEPDWLAESDQLAIRNGIAEGYAIIVRSSAASVTRAKARIIFTEETP